MQSDCLLIKSIQKIAATVLKFLDDDWRARVKRKKKNVPNWNTFSFKLLLIFTDRDLAGVTNDDSRLPAQIRSCTCRSYSTASKYNTITH